MIRGISALIAICVALFLGACKEQDISGIYHSQFESGIYVHDAGACEPPYKLADGTSDYCYEPIQVMDELGLRKTDHGDLQFAMHLVFFNWHTCSLSGVAKQDGRAWIYRDEEFGERCVLRISQDKGGVLLTTDDDASCRSYCGARGSISGARFDFETRVEKDATARDIDCIMHEGNVEIEQCEK